MRVYPHNRHALASSRCACNDGGYTRASSSRPLGEPRVGPVGAAQRGVGPQNPWNRAIGGGQPGDEGPHRNDPICNRR
jgi:hypothetical protein